VYLRRTETQIPPNTLGKEWDPKGIVGVSLIGRKVCMHKIKDQIITHRKQQARGSGWSRSQHSTLLQLKGTVAKDYSAFFGGAWKFQEERGEEETIAIEDRVQRACAEEQQKKTESEK